MKNRYMKAEDDILQLKHKFITLKGITDKLNRQLNFLRNGYDNIKEEMETDRKETKELIDNKNNELKNNIKEEMEKNIEKINNNVDKKTRELLDLLMEGNTIDSKDNNSEKAFDMNSFKADKGLIKLLNKKVTELNAKFETMEEDINNQKKINITKNKEFDDLKQCIVKLYDNIKAKIGKDDLKELYEYYLDHVNEIKFMKSKMEDLSEMQEKMRNDSPNFIKRLETLTHEINQLIDNDKQKFIGKGEKPVDLSDYINEKKLKDILSPITEEIEKLISEIENIDKALKDISEQIPFLEKKEHVDHIQEELNEKMNLLSNRCLKKFVDKIEFNKIIKDIQIKLLEGNNYKKEDADNWLLAKQPLKCFNCATCEANIANLNPPNEYLPWNKYPHGEKQYRIGQGFSKLLQKLNSERNKLFENSLENDASKFLLNSLNNINENIKISNKMNNKDDKNNVMSNRKYKLPRVIENYRKKQKSSDYIPLSDDEKESKENLRENYKDDKSPQIVKIIKVKNENEQTQNEQISANDNSSNKAEKSNRNKISRVQSVPNYNK